MAQEMKGTKSFRVWSVKSLQSSEAMKKKQAVEFVEEVIIESTLIKIRVVKVKATLGG